MMSHTFLRVFMFWTANEEKKNGTERRAPIVEGLMNLQILDISRYQCCIKLSLKKVKHLCITGKKYKIHIGKLKYFLAAKTEP